MKTLNTTININGDGKVFKYIIEAIPSENHWENNEGMFTYTKHDQNIHIFNDNINYVKYSSYWGSKKSYIDNMKGGEYSQENLPEIIKTMKVRVYFPAFSPDVYTNIKYMITVNTWFNGYYIDLGSYLLDRIDTLAVESPKKINDNRYDEYYEFEIIDPKDICGGDDWDNFRVNVCHNVDNLEDLKGEESIINFTLYPVEFIKDKYIQHKIYYGGQNAINISDISDYFNLKIDKVYTEDGLGISCKVGFKSYYDDIKMFLKKHYKIDNPKFNYNILVIDRNNYNTEYFKSITKNEHDCTFNKNELTDRDNFGGENHFNVFDYWCNWRPGLVFLGVLSIENDMSEQPMYLFSNDIPISQDVFKYLVVDMNNDLQYINLEELKDMKHYNINAVNKIINNVIKVDKPGDSKSNIVQPIFFRSVESNSIIIHPEVTQNICINLDRYKSKVDSFILKIEGVSFKQIASTSQGIIFKVIGNSLPNKKSEGVYYILDDNYELVTSGKYTYNQ